MLFFQDLRRKRFFRVVIEDRNRGLQNDGAGVEIFVDEMDGAAREFDAIFEGLALRFEARERGEQRRVNVQDAVWIFCDEERREQAHVSGEADEIDFMLVKNGGDLAVVDFAFETFRWDCARLDATRFGALDAWRAFTIADDDGDFRVGNAARRDAVRESFEVRAAAA